MGRVCCQTHSSKVSIKVMYFFQNNVEKIQLQVNLVGFFVTYVEKFFEYIVNKWIYNTIQILNKFFCEKFSVENIFSGMFFYVTILLTFCTLQAKCIFISDKCIITGGKMSKSGKLK